MTCVLIQPGLVTGENACPSNILFIQLERFSLESKLNGRVEQASDADRESGVTPVLILRGQSIVSGTSLFRSVEEFAVRRTSLFGAHRAPLELLRINGKIGGRVFSQKLPP